MGKSKRESYITKVDILAPLSGQIFQNLPKKLEHCKIYDIIGLTMANTFRKQKILDQLKGKEFLYVKDICDEFNVSLSTTHRVLNELAREGAIKKEYGKVYLVPSSDFEIIYAKRMKLNVEQKQKIAKKAMEYLNHDECYFLDDSTTVYYFAKELANSKISNLTIITNSPPISQLFLRHPGIRVIISGGSLHKDLNALVGPHAISTISSFNADKFFLSSQCLSLDRGLTDMFDPPSHEVKKAMMDRSKQSIVLIDSTKLELVSWFSAFSINEVDIIITDSGLSKEIQERYKNANINLVIA